MIATSSRLFFTFLLNRFKEYERSKTFSQHFCMANQWETSCHELPLWIERVSKSRWRFGVTASHQIVSRFFEDRLSGSKLWESSVRGLWLAETCHVSLSVTVEVTTASPTSWSTVWWITCDFDMQLIMSFPLQKTIDLSSCSVIKRSFVLLIEVPEESCLICETPSLCSSVWVTATHVVKLAWNNESRDSLLAVRVALQSKDSTEQC